MKIKLCGDGALADDVAQYFTVGKEYDVADVSATGQVFSVIGDDGLYRAPAIFKDSTKCNYLIDCIGNLYWELCE